MPKKRPARPSVDAGSQSITTYLRRWLETVRETRSLATYAMYETLVRLHVFPTLGERPLKSITAEDIEGWQSRLERKGISPYVRRRAQQIVGQDVQPLVDEGALGRNVFRLVTAPEAPKPKVETLTEDEVRRLLEHSNDSQTTAMILLASTAMLRIGEIIALRVGDFDSKAATITTHHAVSRNPKRGTKNLERRTMPLPAITVKAIRTYLKSRLSPKVSQPLFSGANGKKLSRHNFRNRVWVPLLEQAEVPLAAHFDSLRYSGTGMLLKSGLSASVVASRARLNDARMIKERHVDLVDKSQPTARQLNKAFGNMVADRKRR